MASKRKMPVKTAPMDLAEDGYEGFVAQVRTNLASGYIRDLPDRLRNGLTEEAAAVIFLKLFPSWEGFVDDDGKDIPHTAGGLRAMPDDLTAAMWRRRAGVIQGVVMPAPLESKQSPEPSKPDRE